MNMTIARRREDQRTLRPKFSWTLRSEWIKLFSLPSSILSLLGIFAVGVGGSLFLGVTLESSGAPSVFLADLTMADITTPVVVIGQIIAGIFGVVIVGAEYASGSVQPTFTAVPDRLRVLRAKAVVAFAAAAGTGAITVITAWAVSTPFYAQFGLAVSLAMPGVALAMISSAVYLGFCALFGVGIAAIVRSTTAGSIIVFLATLLLPVVVSLMPFNLVSRLLRIVQFGNAGDAMSRLAVDGAPFLDLWGGHISVSAGWVIAGVWAVVVLLIGAVTLRTRDV